MALQLKTDVGDVDQGSHDSNKPDNDQNVFRDAAPRYATYLQRSTTAAAECLLAMAADLSSLDANSRVLDVGTGTGAVVASLRAQHILSPVLATDVSPEMLRVLDDRLDRERWPLVRTRAVDAHDLVATLLPPTTATDMDDAGNADAEHDPVDPSDLAFRAPFSHVFAAFVLQFTARPDVCLEQMRGVLADDGVLGATVWTRLGVQRLMARVLARATSGSSETASPVLFTQPMAWTTPEQLADGVRDAGFVDVRVQEAPVPLFFESAETFAEAFFNSKNPTCEALVAQWPGGDRAALKEAIVHVARTEFDDARGIDAAAAFVVGRKGPRKT